MDEEQPYQWNESLGQHLGLGKWQALTLAGFSLGVMDSRYCTLSIAAEKMGILGKADTVERRLRRWLNNPRIKVAKCQAAWMDWRFKSGAIEGQRVYVLVDETSLSNHMSVMMVGLAYRRRCIGLVWPAYPPKKPPSGQVKLIAKMLRQVKAVLPKGLEGLVEG